MATENSDTGKTKRERSTNFSLEETELLVRLVERKKHIIENKKSDASTWQDKEKAWKDIEQAFNRLSGAVYRNNKNLKLKYEGLKRDIRKKRASLPEGFSFGDDTYTAPVLTPVEQRVQEIILSEGLSSSAEGNDSSSDLDTVEPCIKPRDEDKPMDLMEQKIEATRLKQQCFKEELKHKAIQRKILEEELEHKRIMHDLEKEHLILKIDLLKSVLQKNKK